MSSTKSSTGHLLGASGSIEAIFSILSLKNNEIPPTLILIIFRKAVRDKFSAT